MFVSQNQVPCIGVVFELEVPIDAFAAATYQTADDLRKSVVSDHGCRHRMRLAVTRGGPKKCANIGGRPFGGDGWVVNRR